MLLVAIAAVTLLVLAVASVYEIAIIYRARAQTDKAKMVESHSRAFEGGELFGFILAGILMYMSALDIIVVAIVIVVGLYHLGGTFAPKQMMLQYSLEKLKRFLAAVMTICFVEIVVAVSVVAWMASNGWIGL
jgi:hypothetical protein